MNNIENELKCGYCNTSSSLYKRQYNKENYVICRYCGKIIRKCGKDIQLSTKKHVESI